MRRWISFLVAAPLLWLPASYAPAAKPVAAIVETTLTTADGQIRQFAFDGDPDTYFASEKNPTAADHFTLVFDKPVAVKSVTATTGRPKGGDALEAGRSRSPRTARRSRTWRNSWTARRRKTDGRMIRADPYQAHRRPETSAGGPRDRDRFRTGRDRLQVPRRSRRGRVRRPGDEGMGRQGRAHLRARISAAVRRPQERRLEAAPRHRDEDEENYAAWRRRAAAASRGP